MQARRTRQITILVFVFGFGLPTAAYAQRSIRGVITDRNSDGSLTMLTDDSTSEVVVLTDSTSIREYNGLRFSRMGAPSLIPGLRVRVRGSFDDTNNIFTADRI